MFATCLAVLSYHEVDNSLSSDDKKYISQYLALSEPLPESPSYEDEIQFIAAAQKAVLTIAPQNKGIPLGQLREPKELFLAGSGLCYDRSRVIEKILRHSGFKTRHIFLLTKQGPTIRTIAADVSSHAATEVLTQNGWLVVDSNEPWLSLDVNKQPVSINQIPTANLLVAPPDFYTEPFVSIYGLYSRHGKFYPPYNFIPDIEYSEFIQNLF